MASKNTIILLLEHRGLDPNTVTVYSIDTLFIEALQAIAQKDLRSAKDIAEFYSKGKPEVRAAIQKGLGDALSQTTPENIAVIDPTIEAPKFKVEYLNSMVLFGYLGGNVSHALGLSDNGAWSVTHSTVQGAAEALLRRACKEADCAADILLMLPADIWENPSSIPVGIVRENLESPDILLHMVRRARLESGDVKVACSALAKDLAAAGKDTIRVSAEKVAQEKNTISLFDFPTQIQEVYLSHDYDVFLSQLADMYTLSDDQIESVEEGFFGLWAQKISPDNVAGIAEKAGTQGELAQKLAKDIFLNGVLIFPDVFGDMHEKYVSLGGDPKKDISQSRLAVALQKLVQEIMELQIGTLKIPDIEKERRDMKALFESQLVIHFYADDSYKWKLNNTILVLLDHIDGYEQELLNALYANKQHIGDPNDSLDGKESTVANWIKDFLDVSQGDTTTLTLAKYLTQSKAVQKLHERHREAVRKLLELFLTLKNFPASIQKMPQEQWMIIPYAMEEKQISRSGNEEGEIVVVKEVILPAIVEEKNHATDRKPVRVAEKKISVQPPITTPAPIFQKKGEFTGDFDALAHEVMIQSGVLVPPDVQLKAEKILVTRFRNVRNAVELKEKLIDAASGIRLSVKDAERIVDLAEQALLTLHLPEEKSAPEMAEEVSPALPQQSVVSPQSADPHPAFASVIQYVSPPKPEEQPKKEEPKEAPQMDIQEVDGVPTLVDRAESPAPPVRQSQPASDTTPQTPASSVQSIPVIVRSALPRQPFKKTTVADVRPAARLMDAAEELRTLSLRDFRRISPDPVEAARKITQKIRSLEKDSFSKMIAATEAWKQSEVHQLYIAMGQESFGRGIGMAQVIQQRAAASQPALTEAEFDALVEMNEALQY